jgi:glycosyltransferase involved in cell wall biosynthesis/CDP-glycerol glycerophosphotransferase (TagB/SpsB family)
MGRQPKISVIVPVYNNADTINRCLRSIRAQTFPFFEVIVVDDGSTDSSLEKCREFCASDDRFLFIPLKHGGVSTARNAGLDRAQGEYVTFWDADDTFPIDSLKFMHQATVINDADTVCGIYERVDGITTYRNQRSYHLANKARRIQCNDVDMVHSWSLCNKWFSMGIIRAHHLRFKPLVHLEDAVFLYSYLRYAEDIFTCPHVVYTYRKPLPTVGRTTTQQIRPQLLADALKAYEQLRCLTDDYGEAFLHELQYRFINVPLIGDYYRRLWKLDDTFAAELARTIDDRLKELDKGHFEKLLSAQGDIVSTSGIRTKDFLILHPETAIIITPKYQASLLPDILEGLYDQSAVSFQVLVPDSLMAYISSYTKSMPNLSSYSGGIESAFRQIRARFVAVVDQPIIYDHRSLLTMAKALRRNDSLNAVELPVYTSVGDQVDYTSDMLANKLFRASALDGTDCWAQAAAALSCKRLKKPVVIWKDIFSAKVKQDVSQLMTTKNANPSLSFGGCPVASFFSQLQRSFKHFVQKGMSLGVCKLPVSIGVEKELKGTESVTTVDRHLEKIPQPEEKPVRTVDYYLNLDIDSSLIVIEGLGKQPRGNSFYIVQEFQKAEYTGFRIAFSVTETTRAYAESVFAERGYNNVKCVIAGSGEYKRAVFSASILFNEVDFPNWWVKKPHQTYINIWHGTPLKKLGLAKNGIVHKDANASRNFTMADYVLCANEYSIRHILGDCGVLGLTHAKALMLGYPRTGQLFSENMRIYVRERFGIADKRVYDWMPTYREFLTSDVVRALLEELDEKLSDDEVMYVNLHHKTAVEVSYKGLMHIHPFPRDLDTYEFLCAVDALVTDYSSILFDFAVTRRKVILHCPDKTNYGENRGLYRSVDDLPFPVTKTSEQLIQEIRRRKGYDDSAFIDEFAPYDSGDNVSKLCKLAVRGASGDVEVRDLDKSAPRPMFIVSDSLEPGQATDLLYQLEERKAFGDGIYLSFTESGVDKNTSTAYPLVEEVPIYATKGKPLSERTEEQRLYNDLHPRAVVVLDTASIKRVRCFARFDSPTYLFVQPELAEKVLTDKKALKALKLFAKWGGGLFAQDSDIARKMSDIIGCRVDTISAADEFIQRFIIE